MTMTQLRDAIARLRRAGRGDTYYGIEDDIDLVCDALEAHLKPAPAFDKTIYQREYMRRRRAEEKLRKAVAKLEINERDFDTWCR
jgi:hypothetical protein